MPNELSGLPLFLTYRMVNQHYSLPHHFVRRMAQAGQIQLYHPSGGRKVLINREELEKAIAASVAR